MTVRVLFFAQARDAVGAPEVALEVTGEQPLAALLAQLVQAYPDLVPLLPHCAFAMNGEWCDRDAVVPADAEVAVLPPVSGGSALLSEEPIDPAAVLAGVGDAAQGALVSFVGRVRDRSGDRQVLRLEYDAYRPLAEEVLAEICDGVGARWPGAVCVIRHRLGICMPGEVTVVIGVAAPHRGEAFDACRHALERLKRETPIWKHEQYPDGAAWVAGPRSEALSS